MIETGVIIMCSSTAALVTFWKNHIATYVAPLYSHLCSHYSKLATRFKFASRVSSSNLICPPESDQSKPYHSLYNLDYIEINEHHQESAGLPSCIVRTDIGGGSPIPDVENGVIRKFTKMKRSIS